MDDSVFNGETNESFDDESAHMPKSCAQLYNFIEEWSEIDIQVTLCLHFLEMFIDVEILRE